jgi:hypothetical protein
VACQALRTVEQQLQQRQRQLVEEEARGEASRAEAEGALRALKGQVQATHAQLQLLARSGGADTGSVSALGPLTKPLPPTQPRPQPQAGRSEPFLYPRR